LNIFILYAEFGWFWLAFTPFFSTYMEEKVSPNSEERRPRHENIQMHPAPALQLFDG
jgi:hypothetical protein